jgi:hypothetical protein
VFVQGQSRRIYEAKRRDPVLLPGWMNGLFIWRSSGASYQGQAGARLMGQDRLLSVFGNTETG